MICKIKVQWLLHWSTSLSFRELIGRFDQSSVPSVTEVGRSVILCAHVRKAHGFYRVDLHYVSDSLNPFFLAAGVALHCGACTLVRWNIPAAFLLGRQCTPVRPSPKLKRQPCTCATWNGMEWNEMQCKTYVSRCASDVLNPPSSVLETVKGKDPDYYSIQIWCNFFFQIANEVVSSFFFSELYSYLSMYWRSPKVRD
jgi:hypothetical protein